jgi:DNA gyrase subunit A
MFATVRGTVKKTALSAYANIRQNGLIAIGLDEGDALIGVQVTSGKDHVMLGTKTGLAIRFEESDVRAMGRPAGGVIGAKFKREGDQVIDMVIVPADAPEGICVLTGCVNGYGKRTPLSDYPVKGRGTQGVINIDAGDRNGEVVGMKLVHDTDDVIFMTEKGIVMRTSVAEIRQTGRNAAGVRLMKLDEGDRLVALAVVEHDDTEVAPPTDAAGGPPTEGRPPTEGGTAAAGDGGPGPATPPTA